MSMLLKRPAPSEYQSMSRHSLNMRASIGCDRELASHRSGTQALQFHVPVDSMNCSDGGTHAKPKIHSCRWRMASNFVSRFSGSTVSHCRWGYKQSKVLEMGISKLSRLMHMPSEHYEVVPCPLWPRVFGACDSVTVRATAIHKAES
jgi:hypothetical protein